MNRDSYYKNFIIYDFGDWTLYLHESQSYLGRTYLLSNYVSFSDLLDLPMHLKIKLLKNSLIVKKAIHFLFKPDKFNYAALGNVFPKLHFHIIPRYIGSRKFMGYTFTDLQWGKNYSPYNKNFILPIKNLMHIKLKIREKLNVII